MAEQKTSPSREYLEASTVATVNVVMWLAASFAIITVSLRVYVRAHLRNAFGLDDAIAIAATVCLIAYAAVCSVATNRGLGRHIEFVLAEQGPSALVHVALLTSISQTLAIMACTLGKTSFAVTLMRIVLTRWMHYLLWFIIISMNIVNILAAIFVFVQCKDPRTNWNPTKYPSACWPKEVFTNFSLFVGSYSGAQDVVLALLPWVVVMPLQMKRRERLAVAVAMSLGVFAGATAIIKVTYLPALSKKTDFTWALPPLLWWAAAEDGLAIVASSIPVLRPLLQKLVGSGSKQSAPVESSHANRRTSPQGIELRPAKDGQVSSAVYGFRPDADDDSDKSILEEHQHGTVGQRGSSRHLRRLSGGISRTKEITVTYGSLS